MFRSWFSCPPTPTPRVHAVVSAFVNVQMSRSGVAAATVAARSENLLHPTSMAVRPLQSTPPRSSAAKAKSSPPKGDGVVDGVRVSAPVSSSYPAASAPRPLQSSASKAQSARGVLTRSSTLPAATADDAQGLSAASAVVNRAPRALQRTTTHLAGGASHCTASVLLASRFCMLPSREFFVLTRLHSRRATWLNCLTTCCR